jgi:hypothetical protein
LNEDVIQQILLELDYDALRNACQTNVQFNNVCKKDLFWISKIQRDFPSAVPITQYKSPFETFRQQYESLLKSRKRRIGRIDEIVYREAQGQKRSMIDADIAAANGNLDTLIWLDQSHVLLDESVANKAAENGHLYVLQWLETKRILPNGIGVNQAAGKGRLDVLQWLALRNIFPDESGYYEAKRAGHSNVLRWLRSKGIRPE